MIYDENRKQAVIFAPQKGWTIAHIGENEAKEIEGWQNEAEDYEKLWKIFHDTIAIKEQMCIRDRLIWGKRTYSEGNRSSSWDFPFVCKPY